ncbi:MAG: methylmalonyl-CoA epimerase [Candidatus Thorarchaeota archaeon]
MSDKKIAHIGIAVKSLDEWIPYYRDVLGLEYKGSEEVEEQKVQVAFFKIGESMIELLEPTSEDSPISKFIEKRGGGIHHLAVQVEDIEADLAKHKESEIRLIDEEPRIGAHEMKIAFVHPKSTGGVLLELCQEHE